ncbi:SusC/RagA family TonB-linked outer membrane protein [Pedobacter frigoris]|uniref:SusC/RagA family TonB-linked outer membrane protein n=1 Tax=Pedobacter frigoris TaxID=2571272 RepID=UPI00292F4B67|nr:SusC/RagA family TonB-linked outer membrane protein [Pedobacter frigoris]
MKLTFLLITTLLVQISAASLAQKITINQRNIALDKVLAELRDQSGYDFLYTTQTLKGTKPVSLTLQGATLQEALDACFKNQPITYVIQQNTVVIQRKTEFFKNTFIPPVDVKGKVLDENGLPLIGATVKVKGTDKATITNSDGEFELKGVDDRALLVISFMGYKQKETEVSQGMPSTIKMELNSSDLEEVAVMVSTGYQKIPKERATGSFSTITAKDMEGKLQTSIVSRLEGLVAGLTSYKDAVNIRGVSTLLGGTAPLYVVDGAPFEGAITAINPADVESITVLKDATAASIYGARSANGVIVITTKSGKAGPMRINYDGSLKLTPLPDRDYANKMSSAEFVDFQREMFNYRSGAYAAIDPRKSMNDVYRLLYEQKQGNLTEAQLQTALDVYRNNDRYDQVIDEFLNKTALTSQHNLSFSGGSSIYKYNLSGNYLGTNPYERVQSTRQLGFNLKNTFDLTKWMRIDLGILGTNNKSDYDNGISGMALLNTGRASYYMLRDPQGNPVNWLNTKSQFEIDRLNGLGLMDENYAPVNELNKQHLTSNSNYLNINFGGSFKIYDGLSLDLRFQKERTESYSKQLYDKNAYAVKTQINDATFINKLDGVITRHIPVGGQVNETRSDRNSHTLRAQLNYSKLFGDRHQVDVIAGAEQRKVLRSGTNVYKYGYDDFSLNYKPINEDLLSVYIKNTESIYDQFMLSRAESGFTYGDDRYVSFYGNASYTFDRRLTATGSIRMDQSNLFGTDPKYQYKPLWSAGLQYVLSENKIEWLDRLSVRSTYGINGNIPKSGGPYMITQSDGNNYYTKETQDYVSSPPNSGLRWEKTKVTNLAIDFSVLKRRLSGTIEFYNKSTEDLLGTLLSDPTIGWSSILVNYGSMRNRGIEVALNSDNIRTGNFRWNTILNFAYNKNELTRLENGDNTLFTYVSSGQNRVGKPMNSIYSIRYGGLDNLGRPIGLKADGTEVKATDKLAISDLIYEGTATPPYSASLQNNFSYKGFDLYFMFIYYGGHVMRDVMAPYLTKYPELNYTTNMDKQALNYWKKAGDELIPGIAPGFYDGVGSTVTQLWEAGNQHIRKADYIKLRDVNLGYSLSNDFLKRNYIQRVRFMLQVQNAWRWSANKQQLDPEVWNGTSLTPTRGNLIPPTYTFGLSVNF